MAEQTETTAVSPFENRPLICATRVEDADPDEPHCEGTVIIVLRIPESELPKMVTMTSISSAESWRLIDSIKERREKLAGWGR